MEITGAFEGQYRQLTDVCFTPGSGVATVILTSEDGTSHSWLADAGPLYRSLPEFEEGEWVLAHVNHSTGLLVCLEKADDPPEEPSRCLCANTIHLCRACTDELDPYHDDQE